MDLTRYFESRGVELCDVVRGLRTPLSFGDPAREHMATRRDAGLFDFSFMGCRELEGPDAVRLLEAAQTRRLADLRVGRIRYTLLLREDGTVLNDATVWHTGEDAWLVFTGRREDFQLGRAHDFAVIALQGPRSRELLARVIDPPAEPPYFGFAESTFRRTRCLVARIGYSGERGYEVVIDAHDGAALWEALRDAGATECGFTAVNTLRIEAGHILFSSELSCRVTPRALRLERLVDIGVNAEERGQSRLAGLLLEEPTTLSTDIGGVRDERAIATSACRSPLFERWIGLGFVSGECRHPGTRVTLPDGARATVARLPFYDPMKRLPRS